MCFHSHFCISLSFVYSALTVVCQFSFVVVLTDAALLHGLHVVPSVHPYCVLNVLHVKNAHGFVLKLQCCPNQFHPSKQTNKTAEMSHCITTSSSLVFSCPSVVLL